MMIMHFAIWIFFSCAYSALVIACKVNEYL